MNLPLDDFARLLSPIGPDFINACVYDVDDVFIYERSSAENNTQHKWLDRELEEYFSRSPSLAENKREQERLDRELEEYFTKVNR
jgi:hypothetical protein